MASGSGIRRMAMVVLVVVCLLWTIQVADGSTGSTSTVGSGQNEPTSGGSGPVRTTGKGRGAVISIDVHAVLGFVFGAMTIVYYSLRRDEC